ncbi:Cytochrome c, mono-and diheme variants [Halopseudomonas sabulinigri]|uniref:Cytochrome c, mono-and diheme variants n=1 Tax=Halopseudomonas sabulinigri TaxID=472181 RepID=A0A1H1SCI7_9GAMM|nr:Cytochrome c, mono-and diheme variants [Halopseudomonas sabulinigri]
MRFNRLVMLCLGLSGLSSTVLAADAELIERGKYLATAADCVACHTTPGGKPFAGGVEFKLPFGSLYSPNITPDDETGIGSWSDEDFVSALHSGVGKDGKHYYPAFPYTSYTLMPEDEVLAIKAYLASLEPVSNTPPENTLGFPFNQRWGMFFWNFLFLDEGRYAADPQQSEEWNRGAYLVQGPGHCAECHTPRNMFQALDSSQPLAGTLVQGWQAYNISADEAHGIGAWSEAELVSYMSQGHAAGKGVAAGPMAEVVEKSLQHLQQRDLSAIATYLLSTEPQPTGVARPTKQPEGMPAERNLGVKVFADACASCHRWDGKGNQSPVATLMGLKTVNDPAATNLLGILLTGHGGEQLPVDQRMPRFADGYSDPELAAVSSFVLQHFGQSGAQVSAEDVAAKRGNTGH